MTSYYDEKLAAERLRACYDVAPPRVRSYLEAEIAFVLERATPTTTALELGCGYGRVLEGLAPAVRDLVGIDTSLSSLLMAREFLGQGKPVHLAAMDAARMGFPDGVFDLTICIQNGISAFARDPRTLLNEAARVTRKGGTVLFSSYAERFWPDRLEWFEAQSAAGLIGPIDREATGNGVIVCTDGFRATTTSPERFASLAGGLGLEAAIFEVDGSSVFCQIRVP